MISHSNTPYFTVNNPEFKDKKTCPEGARDMVLELSLVARTEGSEEELLLHTQQIPVWIKAAIDQQTLRRTTRRMPKGWLSLKKIFIEFKNNCY